MSSPFTEPLIEWEREYIRQIKQLFTPIPIVKSKYNFGGTVHPRIQIKNVELLQNPSYNFVNELILSAVPEDENKKEYFITLMIIVFCTKKLVQHWTQIYSLEKFRDRIIHSTHTLKSKTNCIKPGMITK